MGGYYYVNEGSEAQTTSDMVETLFVQVQAQSEKIELLQVKLFDQQSEILSLKLKLSTKYEHSLILKSYLDSMPYPAWIKKVSFDVDEKPVFTMWYINKAYEKEFKITNSFYTGKTDFDVWTKDIAQEFHDADVQVLNRMDQKCLEESYTETAFDSETMVSAISCKWPIRIEGNVGISGIIKIDKR